MENIFLLEEVLKFQKLSGLISEKDYKTNLKKINTFEGSVLGVLTEELQKEYIRNINRSSLFTESESKYLKDYFKKYSRINESNIRKHNLLLKEGFFGDVAKFFGDAWNKIKQVYGNIKEFVLKVWEFLKDSAIKISNAVYTYVKNQLSSSKQVMLAYIAKVQDKQGLSNEINHCKEIFVFLKNLIAKFWDTLTSKLQSNPELNSGDLNNQLSEIFKSRKLFKLFETAQGGGLPIHPEDLIKNPAAKRIVTWLSTALRIVLNPLGFLIVLGIEGLTKDFFAITNKAINKIGGPAIITWVILPAMITVGLEKSHDIHGTIEQLADKFLGALFPEVKQLVQVSTAIYSIYGFYEIFAGLTNI